MRICLAMVFTGCGPPPEKPPPVPIGDSATPTVPPPEPTTAACAPVDVSAFTVSPLPGDALGLDLAVALSAPADVEVVCALAEAPPIWRQLVPFGSPWRFLDTADPGSGWTDPTFDDSGWSEGRGPFAAVDAGETVLASGDRTVWFRIAFEVADAAAVLELIGAARRDDGFAVWLNGQEVFRDNLPTGTLTATTPASSEVSGLAELSLVPIPLAAGGLVDGANLLAVEVHPASLASVGADLSFDLRLAALLDEPLPDPPEVHRVSWEDGADPPPILGVLAEAAYTCTATSGCPGAVGTAEVHTSALSVPPPRLATRPGSAPSWGAYTLFNHQRPCADDYANRLYLVDPDGQIRWVHDVGIDAKSSIDLEAAWLGDGTILWGGGEQPDGKPQIVALDHTVAHEAAYPGVEGDVYHHDVAADGDEISGLVIRPITDGAGTHEGFGIVAYDRQSQTVTWDWDAQGAVDAGTLPPPLGQDPYHANAFANVVDADGPAVYVTLLYSNTVIRVDKATGDISWTLGRGGDFALVDPSGNPLPDEEWFDGLHSIEVDNDRLLVYENGRDDYHSRALELTLDIAARVATKSWSWTEFGWYEPVWGDVDALPNGAVLVAMAHNYCLGGNPAHPGALLEVDRATGGVGWRLDFLDGDDATYRAQRIDGCALFSNQRFCPEVP